MAVNWPEQLGPDDLPDPNTLYPDIYGPNMSGFRRVLGPSQVVFLRPLVQSPLTEVGEYTYFAEPDDPLSFERRNVLFHYGPGRLIIGRYCAIARDVRFLMGAAQHHLGVSAFPFAMFGGAWLRAAAETDVTPAAARDLRVGNDVWIGAGATILAGSDIGDGAVIGAGSVVAGDIAPYAVVAGNPAQVIRYRYDERDVERLRELAWWDWPAEDVARLVPELMSGDVSALAAARARSNPPWQADLLSESDLSSELAEGTFS